MHFLAAIIVSIALGIGVLNACAPTKTHLEQIISRGELRVITRHSPTTYYMGDHGPAGLEYELLKRFADHLGVELKIITPDSLGDIFNGLRNGDAQFAAAGLTITPQRQEEFRFTPAYQKITQQLIYNANINARPKALEGINGTLEVVAQSSHSERLQQLSIKDLKWHEKPDADTNDLLTQVAEGKLDFTIIDSNEFSYHRRYYPELHVAFDVSEPEQLAWAFPKGKDDTLYNEAIAFINQLSRNGELQILLAQNYQHVDNYDYRGSQAFLNQIQKRLPLYREHFEEAGRQYNIDWRLLAAVAYQESHWNPDAVSPTGVRGMMMLTQATADDLGIQVRTDVEESIQGGAKYLRTLIDAVPERIPEPDRTWIALAAYNVGYGHLEDARVITQIRNGNRDSWLDIKANLPLLSRSKWYKNTRFGYARGYEPVMYVDNIRSYFDILRWYLEREDPANLRSPKLTFNFHLL